MALADVKFIKGTGGLGVQPDGEDHISGLLFYGVKPALFGTDTEKQIFSVKEAEDFGLTQAAYPVEHYHISEYFRLFTNGNLWVGYYATPAGAYTFAELQTLQRAANGKLRQVGVYLADVNFTTALVTSLKDSVAVLESEHMPLSVLFAADFTTFTLSTLPDLKTLNAGAVSVVIGQSASGTGATLAASKGYSVTCLGAALGAVAGSSVEENIGRGDFNVSGVELDVIGFATGVAYKSVAKAQLDELDNKHYVFLRKHIGTEGTFFNFDYTASTGDYERIAYTRAIDKAIRGVRAALVPFLNGKVKVDPSTGKLSKDTVDKYETVARQPIQLMVNEDELSGGNVVIDPNQNVFTTNRIVVGVKLVPVGTAKDITVNIGFTTKI